MTAGKWLTRWAYLNRWVGASDHSEPPEQTNICALFWRSVLWTPMFVVGLVATSPLIGLTFLVFWAAPYVKRAWRWLHLDGPVDAVMNPVVDGLELVGGYISAAKQRVCPIVRLTD